MGTELHAQKKPGHGTGYAFRIWSTTTNKYITPLMSQVEAQKWLKAEAKEIAKRQFEQLVADIPARVARARNQGTSSMIPGARLTSWREERHGNEKG